MSYRGADRRGGQAERAGTPPAIGVGVGCCAVVAVVTGFVPGAGDASSGADRFVVGAVAAGLTATAALGALRWRADGATVAVWASSGCLLAAAVVLAAGLAPADEALDRALGAAAVGALATLLLVAVAGAGSPTVDARLRLLPVLAGSLGAAVLLGMVAHLVGVRWALHPDRATTAAVAAAAWTAVAVACLARSRAPGGSALAGLGIIAASVAVHQGVLAARVAGGATVGDAHLLVLVVGALLGGLAAAGDVRAAVGASRAGALASVARAAETIRQADASSAELTRRVHQTRNALAAIAGAVLTLERYHDRLPEAERAELTRAATREVDRLQRLIEPVPAAGSNAEPGRGEPR